VPTRSSTHRTHGVWVSAPFLVFACNGCPRLRVSTIASPRLRLERGFRVLKQDIALAPLHHRLPERIRAHGLICFLALLLHRVMPPKLTDQSPSAALRKLKRLKRVQLHRLTAAGQTVSGLTRHDEDTRHIFDQLDLPLPDPSRL